MCMDRITIQLNSLILNYYISLFSVSHCQRMDIWLQNTTVRSPVPIELKLLTKSWSGPVLCARLRNQLAGDYLREESARCGVMLLVWQGDIAVKQ